MMEKFECKQYELYCIAPVHIGSGTVLRKHEYLYDQRNNEIAFLNESAFSNLLLQHNLIDALSSEMVEGRWLNLRKWLVDNGVRYSELKKVEIRHARAYVNTASYDRKTSLNDVACLSALADGRPFIPGSSIKGALRTAILYRLLTQRQELKQKYWQKLNHVNLSDARSLKKDLSRLTEELEQQLLSVLNVQDGKGRSDASIASTMRGLVVSDAMPVDSHIDTVIMQKVDRTTKTGRNGNENKISLFRECVPAGTKFRFQMTMDKSMLQALKIGSLEDILNSSREFLQFGLRQQKSVFGSYYAAEFAEAENADIVLGGGTGFLSKTLFYALAPDENSGRRLLVRILDKFFTERDRRTHIIQPAHLHQQLDTQLSPRTLKLARAENDCWLLGLCAIKELK